MGGQPAVLIEGPDATGNLFQGGGYGGPCIIKCIGGSFTIMSVAFDKSTVLDAFYISSPKPCYIQGIRTEQRGVSVYDTAIATPDTNFVKLRGGATCHVTTVNSSEVEFPLPNFAIMSEASTLLCDGIGCHGKITAATGCKIYIRSSAGLGDFDPSTLPDGGLPVGPSKILRQYI